MIYEAIGQNNTVLNILQNKSKKPIVKVMVIVLLALCKLNLKMCYKL